LTLVDEIDRSGHDVEYGAGADLVDEHGAGVREDLFLQLVL